MNNVRKIRAHKRYATRLPVELSVVGRRPAQGLLIELGLINGRVSNLGDLPLSPGQAVTLGIGGKRYRAQVRWAHDGLAGLLFESSLGVEEMTRLLCHRDEAMEEPRRYGT